MLNLARTHSLNVGHVGSSTDSVSVYPTSLPLRSLVTPTCCNVATSYTASVLQTTSNYLKLPV